MWKTKNIPPRLLWFLMYYIIKCQFFHELCEISIRFYWILLAAETSISGLISCIIILCIWIWRTIFRINILSEFEIFKFYRSSFDVDGFRFWSKWKKYWYNNGNTMFIFIMSIIIFFFWRGGWSISDLISTLLFCFRYQIKRTQAVFSRFFVASCIIFMYAFMYT